jgi:cellulose synthase/poly-beta-1,6-N-acetylglucosamine synthase-like glycosyltransferase
MKKYFLKAYRFIVSYVETVLIILYFLFVVLYFYTAPSRGAEGQSLLNLLGLALLTDGVYLLLHLPRRPVKHRNLSFDPSKLTIVIACYNGQDVIGNTIKNALVHVEPEQIIVVSDASTDLTVQTAKQYGVRVYENSRNVNKAFSISSVMHEVKTPYVLVLDDDTQISKTFIPTSLLDEGYDAVAFNVLPIKTNTLINALQLFEYRKSMVMGKSLRGSLGAVGNVSGALGLYKTKDLQHQSTKHSGQYGGEDQQRTAFVHLYGTGKGVTYTDSTVVTKAPDTIKSFLRQRCLRWNMSLPELFFVNVRVLFTPKSPYLLKVEKAYKLYLVTTDPLRVLYFWVIIIHPEKTLLFYCFYLVLAFASWLKTGHKDPFWIIFIFPLYSSLRAVCRMIAHLNWFKIKFHYIFTHRFHHLVPDRNLALEYTGVFVVLVTLWSTSWAQLEDTLIMAYTNYLMPVTGKIELADRPPPTIVLSQSVAAQEAQQVKLLRPATPSPAPEVVKPVKSETLSIMVDDGDGITNIARKAVKMYTENNGLSLKNSQLRIAEDAIRKNWDFNQKIQPGQIVEIDKSLVKKYVTDAISPG